MDLDVFACTIVEAQFNTGWGVGIMFQAERSQKKAGWGQRRSEKYLSIRSWESAASFT